MVECGMCSIHVINYLVLFIYLSLNKPGHPVCTLCLSTCQARAQTPTAVSLQLCSALLWLFQRVSWSRLRKYTPCLSGPLLFIRIAGH